MNNSGTLHLKDADFGQGNAGESELLIQVSPKRLSYAIMNAQKQVVILYDAMLQKPLDETLDELLSGEAAYLNFIYKDVKLSIQTFHFTFIPQEFYSQDKIGVYHALISKDVQSKPHLVYIKKAGIKNVFTVSDSLIKSLHHRFPGVTFHSQADSLIEGVMSNYQGDKKLFLNANASAFEILVLSNSGLLFYNIFPYETPDDFNYYLLFVLQQLELTNTSLDVVLSGDIENGDVIYRRIVKYFDKISFASNIRISKFSEAFREVPEHRFFSLLSLFLCE